MADPRQAIETRCRHASSDAGQWLPLTPVPDDAPQADEKHYRHGKPSARWTYRDAKGAILGHVCRFDGPVGKVFLPLTFCRHAGTGQVKWRWKSWQKPRPLFGLDRLAAAPVAPVVVCEGEKSANAAAQLLPDWVTTTTPNGSKAASSADLTPLCGRRVVIWPDNDNAGREYANDIARLAVQAGAIDVRIALPDDALPAGWDAADAVIDGWDDDKTAKFIAAATSPTFTSTHGRRANSHLTGVSARGTGSGRGTKPRGRAQLLDLVSDLELWHSTQHEPYATVPVKGHFENHPIGSEVFRRILAERRYRAFGDAVSRQALEDATRVLEAKALSEGSCWPTWVRVAEHEGCVYLDLCDREWRAVQITPNGYAVIERPPVKFVRPLGMRALPTPEPGTMIETLRRFVNVSDEDDFRLLAGWLVGALRPTGPYPILSINGEQGSGKSLATRMIRSLTDPNVSPCRSLPLNERDLMVTARNAQVMSFDNISNISHGMSDALCRLSTGGGLATRKLNTDTGEVILDAQRPIIMNGITELAGRPDLCDRMILVSLRSIPEPERRPEAALLKEFDCALGGILGALCDAVAAALRHWPEICRTPPPDLPRLADFALWIEAAAPGLGWQPGDFLRAYKENREASVEEILADDPVSVELQAFVMHDSVWEGSASELLKRLNAIASENHRASKRWPSSAKSLGMALSRLAPVLRTGAGITVTKGRARTSGRRRYWTISRSTQVTA